MYRHLRFLCLFPLLVVACGSDSVDPVGDGDGDGDGSGGNASGTGGEGGADPGTSACNLPTLSAPLAAAAEALTVVDWAGKAAAISYTFDDSTASQIANYETINALGVPFTFYMTTGFGGASNPIWAQAVLDGHEIGNHSNSHPQVATEEELDTATAFIEDNLGVTPLTMAAPFGNASYVPLAPARFLINRGVNGGSIAPNGTNDPYNLPTFTPAEGATKDQLDTGVTSAVTQGNWQTLLIHGFVGGSDGAYLPIPVDQFVAHVEGQRDSGQVWIGTVLDVGAYWIAQKLLASAESTMVDGITTYAWTLPDHFPEGRCLRVQSTGTVSQGGTPVTLDPMGYFEISLDAGELSIE